MKFFTQSKLAPHGNCWQTAVACLLDVEPDALPPQSEIEAWPYEVLDGWGGYSNCLQGYLRAHHNLSYVTVRSYEFAHVRPVRPEHVMCGPTVRTEQLRAEGVPNCHHCVVGVNGHAVWDVHPSRAGLISVTDWGLLGVYSPPSEKAEIERQARLRDKEPYALVFDCLCPLHNLGRARERAVAALAAVEAAGAAETAKA